MPAFSPYPRWVQGVLLYLLLTNAVPGGWALFAPADWYQHFPGLGRAWVLPYGPYNEHLVRDVGAFFLSQASLCLAALPGPRLVALRAAAGCLLVFGLPHLVFHLLHLHHLPLLDKLGNVVALSLNVGLLLALLLYRPAPARGTAQ